MKLSGNHNFGTAALYCRLSRDDNMDAESNSIQNQFGLGCNRKFVDGKEKTGAAPFKLNRERSLRNGYES